MGSRQQLWYFGNKVRTLADALATTGQGRGCSNQLLGLHHTSPSRYPTPFQATECYNVAAFPGLKKGESGNGKLAFGGPPDELA